MYNIYNIELTLNFLAGVKERGDGNISDFDNCLCQNYTYTDII